MPRFHFNVHDGVGVPDDEGTELPNLEAARHEAVKLAGLLLQENAAEFWNGEQWDMDVTDERGLILFTLTFLATNAPSTTRF